MTRRRKGRRGQGWEPEEVLAGKVEIGARELAELIQRVNPTDRNLPLAEVTRRYRLKNQLQSLLVRRFGDEVEVSAEREGVALLAHRSSGRSACHAHLAELDDDARSWVQRRLDEAAAPDVATVPDAAAAATPPRASARTGGRTAESRPWPAGAAPSPGAPPSALPAVPAVPAGPSTEPGGDLGGDLGADDLLTRGDEAMAAYDYELARHTYERALAASRGDLPAATALLALLVEHLAAYDDAVALWSRLSPAAARDDRVRTLVALAAAHTGEEARARELVRGLERDGEAGRESHVAAAAEVYQVLARRALERDDDGEAARALVLARQLGGPSQPLLDLERALAAQVARRCAPLEAQAQDAYDAGRTDEAEQRARDVLARWPESRAARVLLSRIEAGRRGAQVDALLARADAAMAQQECAAAVGLLRQAAELDAGRDDIAPRLARAEAAARDQVAQAQVAEVEALFAAEHLDAGLVAYLGLSDPQRARVRGSHPSSMLTWLEEIGVPLAGARAHAAAQAVQALARACAALARGDGHAAEAESAPHEKLLRRVATWRTVRQEAVEGIARSERERAEDQLARAVALFDAGRDPAEIRALVEDIDARRLADAASALDDLRARLSHAESRAQIEARLERALARGDLIEAREAAEAGLAQARDHERPDWQRRRDDIAARLRRAWCVHSAPGDGQRPILDTLGLDAFSSARGALLTPDGAALLLATSLRCWLFLRVVSTRSAQVEQYVILRTPAPLQIGMVQLHDGVVTLAGKQGKLLRLAWGTWDVLAWRDLTGFVGEHERFDTCQLVAGAPYVWLSVGAPNGTMSNVIIDLERWCVHRSLPGPMLQPARVRGPGSTLLVIDTIVGRWGLAHADGTPAPSYRLPRLGSVDLVALHPGDHGLIVLVRTYRDRVSTLHARWISPEGAELAALELGSKYSHCEYLGSDPDRGLLFLALSRNYPERELLVLATGDGLRVHDRAPLPERAWMFQDASGTQRRIMARGPGGLTITPIDGELPRLSEGAPKARRLELHGLQCGGAPPAPDPHLLAFRGSILMMQNEELLKNLRALQRNPRMDARMWADVVATLSRSYQIDVYDEFIAWAQARFPEQADLALDAAQHHARMRRSPEALALLDAIEPRKLAPRRLRHMHHLRGVILLLGGRPDDAHAAWVQGLAVAADEQDECDLRSCIDLVAPIDLDADDGEQRAATSVGQTRRRVLLADRCLARGDVSGALAAIDHEHIWQGKETQSYARLARAYLQSEDQDPVHRFHQLLALAAFDAGSEPDSEHLYSQRLPIPGATLNDEELRALAERVRAHLDEYARRLSAEAPAPA